MKKKPKLNLGSRLNFRIDDDLKDWIQDYTSRHSVTLSALIREYFLNLRAREKHMSEVEQF